MTEFPYTPEGYKQAREWLKDNNKEHLIERELSTDGYSIVSLANHLKETKHKAAVDR